VRSLASLIGTGPLLLDFDGPICSIFAGYPAPNVAAHYGANVRVVEDEAGVFVLPIRR